MRCWSSPAPGSSLASCKLHQDHHEQDWLRPTRMSPPATRFAGQHQAISLIDPTLVRSPPRYVRIAAAHAQPVSVQRERVPPLRRREVGELRGGRAVRGLPERTEGQRWLPPSFPALVEQVQIHEVAEAYCEAYRSANQKRGSTFDQQIGCAAFAPKADAGGSLGGRASIWHD